MTAIPRKLTTLVLKRDLFLCMLRLDGCTKLATVADHRANRGSGGSKVLNQPHCLVAACVSCNGVKETVHGATLDALIAKGVRVLKAATNEQTAQRCLLVPVTYPEGDYQLTAEGERVRLSAVEAAELRGTAGLLPRLERREA